MGELSYGDAYSNRDFMVSVYQRIRDKVIKNFNDMDFENADKRVQMEGYIADIVSECNRQIEMLYSLTFE